VKSTKIFGIVFIYRSWYMRDKLSIQKITIAHKYNNFLVFDSSFDLSRISIICTQKNLWGFFLSIYYTFVIDLHILSHKFLWMTLMEINDVVLVPTIWTLSKNKISQMPFVCQVTTNHLSYHLVHTITMFLFNFWFFFPHVSLSHQLSISYDPTKSHRNVICKHMKWYIIQPPIEHCIWYLVSPT
jgi:hypothetical protein